MERLILSGQYGPLPSDGRDRCLSKTVEQTCPFYRDN